MHNQHVLAFGYHPPLPIPFQVISDKIVILNPIENAYLSLAERNADLLEKIGQMRLIPDGTVSKGFCCLADHTTRFITYIFFCSSNYFMMTIFFFFEKFVVCG